MMLRIFIASAFLIFANFLAANAQQVSKDSASAEHGSPAVKEHIEANLDGLEKHTENGESDTQFEQPTEVNTLIVVPIEDATKTQDAHADSLRRPIKVKFRLFDAGDNVLKGAHIKLYRQNTVIQVIEKSVAIVNFELEEGYYYTIEVSVPGFLTKRIVINSSFNENEPKKDEYRFEVELERKKDYDQFSNPEDVYDYPRVIIEFDTNTRLFKANEEYFLSTQKAFERLYKSNREIKF